MQTLALLATLASLLPTAAGIRGCTGCKGSRALPRRVQPRLLALESPEHAPAEPSSPRGEPKKGKVAATLHGAAGVPERRQQLYFRPVSVTLYCVIALTVQGLTIYSAQVLARNADELSGATKKSLATDTLSCAMRGTPYVPMLCVLFVACRMAVLAATEGLGEPPVWVKACMALASAGIAVQYLLVLLLPCTTERAEEGLGLLELSGEAHDVHPMLWAHRFRSPGVEKLLLGLQRVAVAGIYSGTLGVVLGVCFYASPKLSPAIQCTVFVSLLYLCVYLAIWVVRARPGVPLGARQQAAKRAVIAAGMAVRKGPMLAILFLAARMRAIQLSPPSGMPPPWAQACFYGSALTLAAEVVTAGYVGISGKYDAERSKHGVIVYSASRAMHGLQGAIAGLFYLFTLLVAASLLSIVAADGQHHQLSPTVASVVQMSVLYFAVLVLQTAVAFCQDVLGWTLPRCQDTMLAAGLSIDTCPLLSILFVACRMRALQITNQQGSPQGWAQNCMYMSVFATTVQFVCCLAMPLFTGAACKVDGDGHATLDMRPMIGAYTVSVIKYLALICLHGGVIAVCVACFVMTPETARRGDESTLRQLKELIYTLGWLFLALLIAMVLSSAKVIGLAVKLAIESVDTMVVGVDITIENVAISLVHGFVCVGNLVVNNPTCTHSGWTSKHLMRVDQVILKLNMWRVMKTLGREFEISNVTLKGVDVCYDLPGLHQTSNVHEVVDHLTHKAEPHEHEEQKPNPRPAAAQAPAAGNTQVERLGAGPSPSPRPAAAQTPAAGNTQAPAAAKTQVILKQIEIGGIGARAFVSGMMLRFELADIHFDDFQKQLGENKRAVVGDIVKALLTTVLRTVLSNGGLAKQCLAAATSSLAHGLTRSLSG
eukprot:CAMPEP_0168361180 /NCGR_PEP_ID=MMETSP0228-20121227/2537_1 /TAXON_ID=133427 /ORGANISM="Protoceratium reticulatum, Strain CCCM 535 (=CCMP 1889)" /LENGTH=882 /DNA_ID=CAMNT_0008373857 /DNA_START=112 /DNA_END=2756 /DNA_ORIENTATION=+